VHTFYIVECVLSYPPTSPVAFMHGFTATLTNFVANKRRTSNNDAQSVSNIPV